MLKIDKDTLYSERAGIGLFTTAANMAQSIANTMFSSDMMAEKKVQNLPVRSIAGMESDYPGIREQILHFDEAALPACPRCGSEDTADVRVGIVGRTINIDAATTKFKLIPNVPKPGIYLCNVCDEFFN